MEQFEALSKRLSSSLEAKIAAALTASTNLPRMVPQNFNDNKKVKTHLLVVLFWLMVHREELPIMVVWDCLMYTGSFKADRKNNLIFLASLSILRVHHFRERLQTDYNSVFSAVEPFIASSSNGSLYSAVCTYTCLGWYDSQTTHC